MKLPALIHGRGTEWRQATRVMVAALLTYAATKLVGLQQGYWAVFTVVIVMQGSIGSTLGAATDRLIGTIAGALLGGAGVVLAPHTPLGTGIALTLVVGVTSLIAAIRPQLRVAPVTATILLLTRPHDLSTQSFIVDRILEIALGGFIGVATSVAVFPARSRTLVVKRASGVLGRLAELLDALAGDLEAGRRFSMTPDYAGLRSALVGVEAAMKDADRERASRLADHAFSEAIPRTLWRVRNEVLQIARALDAPFPQAIDALRSAGSELLRAEAAFARSCSASLAGGSKVPREGLDDAFAAFQAAFAGVREAGLIRPLDFDDAGRVFGLAFALDRLRRDFGELADRIDEAAGGR